jgi:nucleotide-binding universal stress UspA family protein
MFRHILIPTDGSSFSDTAVTNGIKLAKEMNAKVTGLHVTVPFHILAMDSEALTDTRPEYESHAKARAHKILAAFENAAKSDGVACESVFVASEHPYEAIINTARDKGCDLILMASHGRHGLQCLLIGSETQKVLTHSNIPVLVYR